MKTLNKKQEKIFDRILSNFANACYYENDKNMDINEKALKDFIDENLCRVELPVKPEIAETRARIEELERALRLNVGKGYTVFLMIPRVDITDRITKLMLKLTEL